MISDAELHKHLKSLADKEGKVFRKMIEQLLAEASGYEGPKITTSEEETDTEEVSENIQES